MRYILPRERFRDYALLEAGAGTIPRAAPRLDVRAEFARRAFEEETADRLSVDNLQSLLSFVPKHARPS
jgi:hypothetical protein